MGTQQRPDFGDDGRVFGQPKKRGMPGCNAECVNRPGFIFFPGAHSDNLRLLARRAELLYLLVRYDVVEYEESVFPIPFYFLFAQADLLLVENGSSLPADGLTLHLSY
jgi:hypothetical protein